MKRLGDGELEIMLAVWGEEEPVSSTLVQEKLRGRREEWGCLRITCTVRRISPGILKMWVMQRLTKPEYTIYL